MAEPERTPGTRWHHHGRVRRDPKQQLQAVIDPIVFV